MLRAPKAWRKLSSGLRPTLRANPETRGQKISSRPFYFGRDSKKEAKIAAIRLSFIDIHLKSADDICLAKLQIIAAAYLLAFAGVVAETLTGAPSPFAVSTRLAQSASCEWPVSTNGKINRRGLTAAASAVATPA